MASHLETANSSVTSTASREFDTNTSHPGELFIIAADELISAVVKYHLASTKSRKKGTAKEQAMARQKKKKAQAKAYSRLFDASALHTDARAKLLAHIAAERLRA